MVCEALAPLILRCLQDDVPASHENPVKRMDVFVPNQESGLESGKSFQRKCRMKFHQEISNSRNCSSIVTEINATKEYFIDGFCTIRTRPFMHSNSIASHLLTALIRHLKVLKDFILYAFLMKTDDEFNYFI
uniref:Uncharacterized protein n=1 Tax=Parascaris univalens TaxID=6257 RepID=A0A915CDQ5_PARUN